MGRAFKDIGFHSHLLALDSRLNCCLVGVPTCANIQHCKQGTLFPTKLQIYCTLCNAFGVQINHLICSFPSLTTPRIDIDRPIAHAPPTRILFTGMWTATRSANAMITAKRGLLTELHHVTNKSHNQETDAYSLRNFGVLQSVCFGRCS